MVIYPASNNTLPFATAVGAITTSGIHVGRGLGLHYHADADGHSGNGINHYNLAEYAIIRRGLAPSLLLAHAEARTFYEANEILAMEIARQNSKRKRSTAKIPQEVWDDARLRSCSRMRPCPGHPLLDLHFSLRYARRVNNDGRADFEGLASETAPTRRKSVTIIHHPGQRFWVVEHKPRSNSASAFVPATNPLLYRRRQERIFFLLIPTNPGQIERTDGYCSHSPSAALQFHLPRLWGTRGSESQSPSVTGWSACMTACPRFPELPFPLTMPEYTRWLNASTEMRDEEMFAGLYAELHKIARGRMAAERSGRTLDATALVHEAWLRLEKSAPAEWRDRKQFYGAAAEAMRRILVEAARRRLAAKRGGGDGDVPFDELPTVAAPVADERLLEVHELLDQLEAKDEMTARIVKLRFFGGMKNEEIAALLEVGVTTVKRRWVVAKVWLYRALVGEG